MIKYMVIGDPIAHSRSPGMQNAAFEALGLGRPYGIRHVTPAELPDFFAFARKNLLGVNLTVPHKLMAAALADELTPRAERCGSVNTLKIADGRILGDSTDGVGLEEALRYCFGCELAGRRVLFCGAGGAARATSVHLAGCGVKEVSFINRTVSKAEELSSLCRRFAPRIVSECAAPDAADKVRDLIARADFLIQATALGLKPDDPPPFPTEWLRINPRVRIFDTIYHETPLQKFAAEAGIACCGGKEMLVRQGAASFALWTGLQAPLEAMRRGFDEGVPGK